MRDGFTFIIVTVLLNATSQLTMKYGIDRVSGGLNFTANPVGSTLSIIFNPFIVLGLLTMTLSMGTHLAALSRFDVGYVFPFISFAYVIVAVLGVVILGEEINLFRGLGIAIIMLGVMVLSWG